MNHDAAQLTAGLEDHTVLLLSPLMFSCLCCKHARVSILSFNGLLLARYASRV